MTEAQDQALQKAYALLGEHYEGVLIVVCTETLNKENHPVDQMRLSHKGGYCVSLGLAEWAKHQILDNHGESE